jgi:hypothetical protein
LPADCFSKRGASPRGGARDRVPTVIAKHMFPAFCAARFAIVSARPSPRAHHEGS